MQKKTKIKDLTIVIVSYKSGDKILKLLKKIQSYCKIIIIENSNDRKLKKKIDNNYRKNIKVVLSKNIGYGNGVNLAFKYVDTKYFLAFGPDINGIKLSDLKEFIYCAKTIKKFGALGPRYINNQTNRNLIQTNPVNKISKINCLSGAVLFFSKKIFKKLKGFDNNIFLFFEENDYSKRANNLGFYSYQINSIKIYHEHGNSVKTKNLNDKNIINLLTAWHFTWSKFYYFKKHYNYFLALVYLSPLIVRCFFKKIYFSLNKKSYNFKKYNVRSDAIIASIRNKKSYAREESIIRLSTF